MSHHPTYGLWPPPPIPGSTQAFPRFLVYAPSPNAHTGTWWWKNFLHLASHSLNISHLTASSIWACVLGRVDRVMSCSLILSIVSPHQLWGFPAFLFSVLLSSYPTDLLSYISLHCHLDYLSIAPGLLFLCSWLTLIQPQMYSMLITSWLLSVINFRAVTLLPVLY